MLREVRVSAWFVRIYTRQEWSGCLNLWQLSWCPGAADRFSFDVDAGQELTVRVDTQSGATAADLCFSADCGSFSFEGDDETDDDGTEPNAGHATSWGLGYRTPRSRRSRTTTTR